MLLFFVSIELNAQAPLCPPAVGTCPYVPPTGATSVPVCPLDLVEIVSYLPDVDGEMTTQIWKGANAVGGGSGPNNPPITAGFTGSLFNGLPTHINAPNELYDAGAQTPEHSFPRIGVVAVNPAGNNPHNYTWPAALNVNGREQVQQDGWLVIPPGLDCIRFSTLGAVDAMRLYLGKSITDMCQVLENNGNGTPSNSWDIPSDLPTFIGISGCEYRYARVRLYHHDHNNQANTSIQWNIGDGFVVIPATHIQGVGANPDSDDNPPSMDMEDVVRCALKDSDSPTKYYVDGVGPLLTEEVLDVRYCEETRVPVGTCSAPLFSCCTPQPPVCTAGEIQTSRAISYTSPTSGTIGATNVTISSTGGLPIIRASAGGAPVAFGSAQFAPATPNTGGNMVINNAGAIGTMRTLTFTFDSPITNPYFFVGGRGNGIIRTTFDFSDTDYSNGNDFDCLQEINGNSELAVSGTIVTDGNTNNKRQARGVVQLVGEFNEIVIKISKVNGPEIDYFGITLAEPICSTTAPVTCGPDLPENCAPGALRSNTASWTSHTNVNASGTWNTKEYGVINVASTASGNVSVNGHRPNEAPIIYRNGNIFSVKPVSGGYLCYRSAPSGTGQIKLTFPEPVDNPLIYLGKNGLLWTKLDFSSTVEEDGTPLACMAEVSKNGAMVFNSGAKTLMDNNGQVAQAQGLYQLLGSFLEITIDVTKTQNKNEYFCLAVGEPTDVCDPTPPPCETSLANCTPGQLRSVTASWNSHNQNAAAGTWNTAEYGSIGISASSPGFVDVAAHRSGGAPTIHKNLNTYSVRPNAGGYLTFRVSNSPVGTTSIITLTIDEAIENPLIYVGRNGILRVSLDFSQSVDEDGIPIECFAEVSSNSNMVQNGFVLSDNNGNTPQGNGLYQAIGSFNEIKIKVTKTTAGQEYFHLAIGEPQEDCDPNLPPTACEAQLSDCPTNNNGANLPFLNNTGGSLTGVYPSFESGPFGFSVSTNLNIFNPPQPGQCNTIFTGPDFCVKPHGGNAAKVEAHNQTHVMNWQFKKCVSDPLIFIQDLSMYKLDFSQTTTKDGEPLDCMPIVCGNSELIANGLEASDQNPMTAPGASGVIQLFGEFMDIKIGFTRVAGNDPNIFYITIAESIVECIAPPTTTNPPVVTVSPVNPTCPASTDGSINLTVNGSGAFVFDWADITSGTEPEDRSNLGVGNYNVTVTDVNGCTATASIVLTAADVTPPTPLCQSITIDLDNEGNAAVAPSQIDNGSSDNCGPITLSLSETHFNCGDVGPNSVTLTVTDGSGNQSTCTATITINPFVTINGVAPGHESCAGANDGTVVVNASAPAGTIYYSLDGVNYGQGNIFENLAPGTYTVFVQVEKSAMCFANTTVTINAGLAPTLWYSDQDNDGYSNGQTISACVRPSGYKTAAELNGQVSGDCNDSDALAFPGQAWYSDQDSDGYGSSNSSPVTGCNRPSGYKAASELIETNTDCNDSNAAVNPGATEVCNGIDDDCDGQVDEGVSGNQTYVGNVYLFTQADVDAFSQCYNKVQGDLLISGVSIDNLAPLGNIGEVTGTLTVQYISATSLSGLDALHTIGSNLLIYFNSQLNTLNGLDALAAVGGSLHMYYNFTLGDCCAIAALLDNGGVSGYAAIFFNQAGSHCNSQAAIIAACNPSPMAGGGNSGTVIGTKDGGSHNMGLFPNPASGTVTVSVDGIFGNRKLRVTDYTGRVVYSQEMERNTHKMELDISHWASGLYIVQVTIGGQKIVEKLVIK